MKSNNHSVMPPLISFTLMTQQTREIIATTLDYTKALEKTFTITNGTKQCVHALTLQQIVGHHACKCNNYLRSEHLQTTRCTDRKLPTWRQTATKSNPGFECRFNPVSDTDNPDLDVWRITPKMLWIHYLLGISHFAKCRENRLTNVWEMLINLLKSPIPQWWE